MASQSPDLSTLLEKAASAQAAGRTAEALRFFSEATELDPQSSDAWHGRASLSPDPDDALVSLAYAFALEPDDERRAQLELYSQLRREKASPSDAGLLVEDAKRLAAAGLSTQAEFLLHRAIELEPGNAEPYVGLAAVGSPENAASNLKRALDLNPDHPVAQAALRSLESETPAATAAPAAAAPEPAIAAIDEKPAEEPAPLPDWLRAPASKEPEPAATEEGERAEGLAVLLKVGEAALMAGDTDRAHDFYTRATKVAPASEAAWRGRWKASKDIGEKLDCLQHVLEINPDNAVARLALQSYMDAAKEPSPAVAETPAGTAARTEAEVEESSKTRTQSDNAVILSPLAPEPKAPEAAPAAAEAVVSPQPASGMRKGLLVLVVLVILALGILLGWLAMSFLFPQ